MNVVGERSKDALVEKEYILNKCRNSITGQCIA